MLRLLTWGSESARRQREEGDCWQEPCLVSVGGTGPCLFLWYLPWGDEGRWTVARRLWALDQLVCIRTNSTL